MQDCRKICVLTGDIVDSTALGEIRLLEAMQALKDCAAMLETIHAAPLNFTRHRGDGWQVVLATPRYGLRSAVMFRAALKSLGKDRDSYIGMSMGAAKMPILDDLNSETANVFVKSGQALEAVKSSRKFARMAWSNGNSLQAPTVMIDHLIGNWTRAQAAVCYHALQIAPNNTATKIAKQLGKSRQAVSKSITAAGFQPLHQTLRLLEETPDD